MADDNFLSDALSDVTGGGNVQNLESELEAKSIQEGEQLFQQRTGIDVASFLGGGSQTQTQGQADSQSDNSDDASDDSSSDDDSSN